MDTVAYSYRADPDVPDFPDGDPVLIFDGECVMCSHSAQFVLRHERRQRCRFAAAQSPLGQALYRHYELEPGDLETIVLLHGGMPYLRSDAAIKTMMLMGFPWTIGGVLRLAPRWLRNRVYDYVARNRFRLFGRRDQCYMPTPETAHRFLS